MAAAFAAIGLTLSISAAIIPAHAQENAAPAATTQTQGRPTAASEPAPATGETAPATGQDGTPPQAGAPTDAAPSTGAPASGTAPSAEIQAAPADATDDATLPGDEAVQVEAGGERQAGLPHDLSPWGMFMAADLVVKGVMVGLAFASFVTWTVLIAKLIELGAVQRSVHRAVRSLTDAQGLAAAEEIFAGRRSVPARMVHAARQEMNSSDAVLDYVSDSGVKERVASRLQRAEVRAGRQIAKGTGILATIGSTAPFVGLFGTVWGIMNSFIGISEAQTTNLAIVAPGIAEALLATAIGLVAAIPAVVFYNFLARAITAYRQGLSDTSAAIERLVSRDLDVRRAGLAANRAAGTGRVDPARVRMG
ncbi:tonB-system energizer ExbB [Rhizobium sp. TRM96647]|uniref:tonB-system energizer ExbB n=1 Tax=unclassified Rhizobium TaxID=2613769 RepID=UPI0021E83631|nr:MULTISPECIES: tonB-system energizer ExbB [unclassified Rhizobium]MCV3737759.1 tonB-system energizer ExbB [Rhizobium sp. TRM96647]MCV3759511.1 tonB-system energizer ExbB [Rhizobium sp. TRM96650]